MGNNWFNHSDRDARFILFEQLKIEGVVKYKDFSNYTESTFKNTVNLMLKEALKVCREVMGPSLQDGDQEGCKCEKGEVTLPQSFPNVWRVLADNGWIAVNSSADFGGQGFPMVVAAIIEEMLYGANAAMMVYGGLTKGTARLIESFGSESDKRLFVEKMYTGVWAGAMCMTEPDSGSDVGYVITSAEKDPQSDDPRIYLLEGNKQFISGGNQNLTENIIHLVLARIKGAPMGTKGLSLFIVPKIWVNPDGTLGSPNDVICTGIEHKMGVNGQATCSMSYGPNKKCRAILLGEPQSGIAKMFQLMNEYRMFTGVQALGMATGAYGVAKKYAKERIQGPLYANPKGERVRLIEHEDIRRMLMNQKAGTEAMRAMVAKVFYMIDIANNDPDDKKRYDAALRSDLLIPIVKAYCTDLSCNLIRDAIQTMGGVGYCKEFPVEQYARDCKISTIVEGTNYIQSRDLVGRKLTVKEGAVFAKFIDDIQLFVKTNQSVGEFSSDLKLLNEASQIVREMAEQFRSYHGTKEINFVPLMATRFLECMAEIFMAQIMIEQGLIAMDALENKKPNASDSLFYNAKIQSAHYFCRNFLPNVFAKHKMFCQKDFSALLMPEGEF